MYTYIDFVMEEHYFLGLPCLPYIFLKVSSTLMIIVSSTHVDHISAEMAAAAGPKRTRQTYTRYQTLELEKVTASQLFIFTPWQCQCQCRLMTCGHKSRRSLIII